MTDAKFFSITDAIRCGVRGRVIKAIVERGNTKAEAEATYVTTYQHLMDADIHNWSYLKLAEARATRIHRDTPFTSTWWTRGTYETRGGKKFEEIVHPHTASWFTFTEVLKARTAHIVQKELGWFVCPVVNTDGHCCNASTVSMHAVFLDCDAAGEWDTLLQRLNSLDYGYVAYQSGGWSPTTPKWRIVLPLATPFHVTTEEERDAWAKLYLTLRVVIGSVAWLGGEGFDSKTFPPKNCWYLTERRTPDAPPRRVIFREGFSLDHTQLLQHLPAIPHKTISLPTTSKEHDSETESVPLNDDLLQEIVDALIPVTSNIPADRHLLYQHLAGTLLSRKVTPDDMRDIIEAVSLNYPRRNPKCHRDNLHGAETTIAKWEQGEPFTQIGELQKGWPEIADALDGVLPDIEKIAMRKREAEEMCTTISMRSSPTSPEFNSDIASPVFNLPVSPNREELCHKIRLLRNAKRREAKCGGLPSVIERLERHATLLDRVISSKPLTPNPNDINKSIRVLAGLLPQAIPYDIPTLTVLEIVYQSITPTRTTLFVTLYEQSREVYRLHNLRREKNRNESFLLFYDK